MYISVKTQDTHRIGVYTYDCWPCEQQIFDRAACIVNVVVLILFKVTLSLEKTKYNLF